MKYLLMSYIGTLKFEDMTDDERNAMFDECLEYDEHLRANGHFLASEGLQPPETALTMYWKNGKVTTTDGPFVETKEQLGGTGLLEARDLNHAIQLLSQHPALKYGPVFEMRPVLDMSEMKNESEERRRQKTAR